MRKAPPRRGSARAARRRTSRRGRPTLGAEARFVGKRGSDAAGELAASELRERGVELLGPVEEGRNGVVVSLVVAGREPDDV